MILVKILLLIAAVKIVGYYIILMISRFLSRKPNIKNIFVVQTTSVCILVPMFNEEKIILCTIGNLLKIRYENFKIILIDDGSTDETLNLVRSYYQTNEKVCILSQNNGGKASALNRGIQYSEAEILLFIDADTIVNSDLFDKILPHFQKKEVAAVAGYLKVGNRVNALTNLQHFEYVTNQNFTRSVFSLINGIFTVPGAIGAFRKSLLIEMNGLSAETLTEDSDLTLKMLSSGYVVENAPEAIG